MTLIDCNCPVPSALVSIPGDTCFNYNKVAKIILQRLDDTTNVFDTGVPDNPIIEEASWTDLPDAIDDTKVVITPVLEEVTFAESAILEDGENFDGAPNVVATGPQMFSAIIRNPSPLQKAALAQLSCEPNLVFYLIDKNGKILARAISESLTAGIKISKNTFVVSEPSRGGALSDQFKIKIQFYLASGWFDTAAVFTPEAGFDPINDIEAS